MSSSVICGDGGVYTVTDQEIIFDDIFVLLGCTCSRTDQNVFSHVSLVPLQQTYGEEYVWNIDSQ